jgi:hypothetical protein
MKLKVPQKDIVGRVEKYGEFLAMTREEKEIDEEHLQTPSYLGNEMTMRS